MKIWIVDAFTDQAFKGNPAAVAIPDSQLDDTTMLAIAQEMNLSETAFITAGLGRADYTIRYFSPKMEIPLCGHATLGASRVLADRTGARAIHFVTGHGVELPVMVDAGTVRMNFPLYGTAPAAAPTALIQALGLDGSLNTEFNAETGILLLEIADANQLAALKPDFAALRQSHDSINGVLVTAPGPGDGFDFHSRYFWPWSGSEEDPVTGGTHTFLAPYWGRRLNKTVMRSYQSSARSGFMTVTVRGNGIEIEGQAATVLEGDFRL